MVHFLRRRGKAVALLIPAPKEELGEPAKELLASQLPGILAFPHPGLPVF